MSRRRCATAQARSVTYGNEGLGFVWPRNAVRRRKRSRRFPTKRLLAFVVLILASAAAPLRAGDLQVFGGSLDVNAHIGSGTIALVGDRGFTFQAKVAAQAG